MLVGGLIAVAVIGDRFDDDPDPWDCNSLPDHLSEAGDSLGSFLHGAAGAGLTA
jgi:hypothetical protein